MNGLGYYDPMTDLPPEAVAPLAALGAFDDPQLGKSIFKKLGKLAKKVGKVAAPMVANYFAPGSGDLLSNALNKKKKKGGGFVMSAAPESGPFPTSPAPTTSPAPGGFGNIPPAVLIGGAVLAVLALKK